MTRALVTGASGMVGSHLAEYLLDNTMWEIDCLIRWRSPLDNLQRLVPIANEGRVIRFLYGDLRDSLSLARALEVSRPQYVFHLAAQSFPRASFDAPLDTLDTNVQGTLRLLEAIKTHAPSALIHVCSSSEVYGRVPMERLPIDEDCPFHPASPYAISKVGADLIAQHYAQAYGMNICITRMFTHTGPRRGDVFAESSFAKQIAMIEAGMIPPVIKHGNLASMRTIADVRDAVRAYHMLLTVNPKPGEVYNIGGAHSCTVEAILDTLIGMSTISPIGKEQDADRMRPLDADLQVPCTDKFCDHTGWQPTIPFQQTMSDLISYWRERVKKYPSLNR